MCKHRTAFFLAKHKGLSLMACTTGCGQPFWKDKNGQEVAVKDVILTLEKIIPTPLAQGEQA